MKIFITLILTCIASFNAMAKMTHVFYCVGENSNSDQRIFTEVHYQMDYSGKFSAKGIVLKVLPEDISSDELELAFKYQKEFELIGYQKKCFRKEIFPALCKTTLNQESEEYFYTWINTGINTYKFSDYILSSTSKLVNSQNYDSRYSYGKFNREFVGKLIKCNYKWAQNR